MFVGTLKTSLLIAQQSTVKLLLTLV